MTDSVAPTVCKKCDQPGEFYAKSGRICKACCVAKAQRYYFAHHEERKKWHRDNNKRMTYGPTGTKKLRRDWLKALKDHPCMDCQGRFPPECMDFDHRDRSTKRFNIAAIVATARSKAVVLTEIAKCDLVCANCHRIRTAKQMNWL